MMPASRDPRRGVILPIVLIIGLLLSAAMLTFVKRSVIDGMMVRNRDHAARADGLARGGVRLAMGILLQDAYDKKLHALTAEGSPGSSYRDIWARVAQSPFEVPDGGSVVIRIEDAGARFNLNALVPVGKEGLEARPDPQAEEFLVAFLGKIIDELELKTEERLYDPREMARNLLDYIDADDVAIGGHQENDYYQRQTPPYRAPNRPLLSVEEIAMIEGFDVQIMEAMRPYVTVYPLNSETGVNINTAPPHVLGLLYYGGSGDMRLADEEMVSEIMKVRDAGQIVCENAQASVDCVSLGEVGLAGEGIFPPLELPLDSRVFSITSEATVEEIVRRIVAVVDIGDPSKPTLLSWRAL